MWLVGAFVKIPLTAYYSAVEYGGENAFDNPLFMRTNRILTAAWGVFYIVAPIWTYLLLNKGLPAYTGLINSIVPHLWVSLPNGFRSGTRRGGPEEES